MAFRSTADALLARAEALERDNAKLREKLAESEDDDHELQARNAKLTAELKQLHKQVATQRAIERKQSEKREERAARKGRKRARDSQRASGASLWSRAMANKALTFGLAMVVVYGVFDIGYRLLSNRKAKTAKPTIEHVYLVSEGGEQPTVAVIYGHKDRTRSDLRLSSFDLQTGKRRTTATLFKVPRGGHSTSYKTFRRTGHKLWAYHPSKGLQLLNLRTAAVILDKTSLRQALPQLGEYKVPLASITEYSPPTPAVPVVLRDGRRAWIDMTPQLQDAPPSAAPSSPGYFCDLGRKASCERIHCFGFMGLPGTTALQLATTGQYPNKDNTPTTAAGPAPSPLLRPGLVKRLEYRCALELSGNVFVWHDDAATGPKATRLSMVSAVGKIVWTRNMSDLTSRSASSALGGAIIEDQIHLFLSDHKRTLELVRLSKDGKVLAQHVLF